MSLVYVVVHVDMPDWETGEMVDVRTYSTVEAALKDCDETNERAKYGWYIVEVRRS